MFKAFLGVFCFVLYANINPVIGVRREVITEELNNLIKAWDQDRKDIGHRVKMSFGDVVYDFNLELRASNPALCPMGADGLGRAAIPLRWNDVMDTYIEITAKRMSELLAKQSNEHMTVDGRNFMNTFFFNPKTTRIGCSKTVKCSEKFPDNYGYPELAGKTIETRGMCVLDTKPNDFELVSKMMGVKLPSVSNYADIIGVKAL